MKKFFTLITALCALTATAWAQEEGELDDTFVFTDLEGNILADGAVITVNTLNEEGQMAVPVKVKKQAGEKAAVSMYETIDDMPNGTWQTCAFGNCLYLEGTGYSSKTVQADDYFSGIQTEWIPEEGGYASWSATLQIHLFNITRKNVFGTWVEEPGNLIVGYGPKVTINFVYADPAGVNATNTDAGTAALQYFSLSGRKSAAPVKGLNIVKDSDGRCHKKLIR